MRRKDYKEIAKEILNYYNENPKGWQVLVGRSKGGHFNILFSNPEHVWLIKLDTLFKPNPVGFGIKLGKSEKIPYFKAPSYGFRPINPSLLENFINAGLSPEKVMDEVIKYTMRFKPLPFRKIRTPIMAIGPYIHRPKLELFSKKQRRLSEKLDEELTKILERRYSYYG